MMISSTGTMSRYLWLAIATLAINTPTLVHAQGFNPGSFFGGFDDDGNDGFGDGFSGNNGFFTNLQSAQRRRSIHGALASIAFVILFPIGAIALKIMPGRASFISHVLVQMAAWILYIAAAVIGIQLVREVRFGGQEEGWLLTNPNFNYHPIIGIVVLVLILVQPALGYLHHRNFKRYMRRTVPSHLHLWNGRVVVILGIINGGLGLQLAGASETMKLAYTIVAAVLGGSWIILALFSEVRRARGKDTFGRQRGDQMQNTRMERVGKNARDVSSDDGIGGRPSV